MEPTTSSLPYQNDDASSASASPSSSWELRHDDDGFVYRRRRKRPRLHDEPPPVPSPSAAAEDLYDDDGETRRREWKEKALRKLKAQYEAEIEIWELLATRLKAMEEKTAQIRRRRVERVDETTSLDGAVEYEARCSESVLDELLLQAETQEAIIADVTTLCDTVEAMCGAQQEDLAQSLIDLPVWGSPRELMKSLCD